MNELALFAGAGGGILGGELLGHKTVCAVELEEYPRKVLLQRQRDGILPWFPIWDDINTFDGRPWEGKVDLVSGGFPCQDISAAGKGAGIDGERSGLWGEMARVVREVSPQFVFVENSPMLTSRGLHRVLGDLAEMGYDARWCVLGADDAGAPHRRKRIWILAYTRQEYECQRDPTGMEANKRQWPYSTIHDKSGSEGLIKWWDEDPADLPDTKKLLSDVCHNQQGCKISESGNKYSEDGSHRTTKPHVGRVAHGVAKRVDRLKAIGNGQVPAVAAIAFVILSEGLL